MVYMTYGDVRIVKEGNVLFNDALSTFYLRLHGVRHMVKDHSDSERGNLLSSHGLLFPISPTPYNHIKNVLSASLNKIFPSYLSD